jgi:hypothetical protein
VNGSSRTLPPKLTYGALGCLLIYAAVRSIFAATGKPFWYDELLTLTVTSLSSWGERLHALSLPLDGQPPLFYSIEHLALRFTNNQEIALRLPSIIAFSFTLACVFAYVSRRASDAVAFLCAFFLLLTSGFHVYAVEARPYSMVVACIAFAAVCYQRAPSALFTVLLASSFVFAESLHYLAVLAMAPFGLAEATFALKARRIRWQVWAAFAAGAVPLLLQWNLLAANKAYYGPHFWAHFGFSNLPRTYGELLSVNDSLSAGLATLAMGAIVLMLLWPRSDEKEDMHSAESAAEAVLLLGLAALPFIAYVLVVLIMKSGLTARYVLPTLLGLTLAIGFALRRASWKAIVLSAAFVLATVGVQELSFWRSIRRNIRETVSNVAEVASFIDSAGHRELPVAIPNYSTYLPLFHYENPHLAHRLVFLAQSPTAANMNLPTDTVNRGMELLRFYWPIQMSNYKNFTSAQQEFLVYAEFKDPGIDWFTLRLSQEGWKLQILALDNYRMLYLVTRAPA